jgi:ABC-type branched-subunit amino acid transport system ATPase component
MRPGEFVAVMGPSGCGKSTLLNLVAGLDTATDGEISLAGESLVGKSEDELAIMLMNRSTFHPFRDREYYDATMSYLRGESVQGTRYELQAARGVFSANSARVEEIIERLDAPPAEEEEAGAEPEDRRAEAEVAGHLQRGVADVDAIQECDDVEEEDVRHDTEADAPQRAHSNRV